jgi:hypothetical protein
MPTQLLCTCGKQLRIPDEHAGRQVRCPTCGKSLIAPSGPAAAGPARASAPLAAGPGSRWWQSLLPLALVALLFAAAAAGWWFFLRDRGPATEGDDLALVPASAQGFACIRLADLWQTSAARKALQKIREGADTEDPAARMERETGLRPEEVERLSLVGVDADRRIGWIVVRTREPYNRDKVLACLSDRSERSHRGQRYHLGTNAQGRLAAVHFAGTHVLAAGSEEGVQRCLDVAAAPPARGPLEPVIALAGAGKHTAVAGVNPRGGPHEKFNGMSLGGALANVELFTVKLDVSKSATVHAVAQMASENEAEQFVKAVNGFVKMNPFLRGVLLSAALGGRLTPLAAPLNKMLTGMKLVQVDNQVAATVTIDDGSTIAEALLALPGSARE